MTQATHLKERELYLQDCRETIKPWLRWRVSDPRYLIWISLVTEPNWNPKHLFQRIPQIISINGIEVRPAPLIVAPEDGTVVYRVAPTLDDFFYCFPWSDSSDSMRQLQKRLLTRGQLHATKEAAIAHSKALILASGGVV